MLDLTDSGGCCEWTPLDEEAAREGAAVTRLARRTDAAIAEHPSEVNHYFRFAPVGLRFRAYNRAAAVVAFDRLFKGDKPTRRTYDTKANIARRQFAKEIRKRQRALGATLRGCDPAAAREAFRRMLSV
jgi:hypothetical protein